MFEINALAGKSAEQSIAIAWEVKIPSVVQTWIPGVINRYGCKKKLTTRSDVILRLLITLTV